MAINYGKQSITEEDILEVIKVLKSDFLTQGPAVENFEHSIEMYTNSKYATALSSATAGLHVACMALGIKKNDTVWTSPNSFVASSNCALYCDAKIDFVDINTQSNQISISELKKKLQIAKRENNLPKLLIPVHLTGNSCDMESIYHLSRKYKFKILEDASHCIGGSYKGKKIGSCEFSDACVFSFHPVKIITTGEGGAITTNDKSLNAKMKELRTHGITKDPKAFKSSHTPRYYYEQHNLGFNYRITDIQAALGNSQLKRIDKIISKRWKIAKNYDRLIKNELINKPDLKSCEGSSLHLYVIKVKKKRDNLLEFLREKNIYTTVHYHPIHLQPYYKNLGFKHGDFPISEEYGDTALSIPIYPDLEFKDQSKVIEILNSFH